MPYTTYQHEADRDIVRKLARGDWQMGLVHGTEAWDGSTIRKTAWIAEKLQRLGETDFEARRHVDVRKEWTRKLADRIRGAGFEIVSDGPNARIERTDAIVDDPDAKDAAMKAGIDGIGLTYHSVAHVGTESDIAIYKCVVSAVWPLGPYARKERYVLGPVAGDTLDVYAGKRIAATLGRAIGKAKRIRSQKDKWAAYRYEIEARDRANAEARKAAEEAEAEARALAEDAEALAAAIFDA